MLMRLALSSPRCIGSLAQKSGQKNLLQQSHKQNWSALRSYARGAAESRSQITSRTATLKERLMAPAGANAFSLGKGATAGAAVVGLGALCFYGLNTSPSSIATASMFWPQHVRDRIQSTYGYFAGSLGITAAATVGVFNSPRLLNLVTRNGILALGATMVLLIGSNTVTRSIPYQEGFGTKQLAWIVNSALMGAVLAPVCFLGGPLLLRAACYTAGIAGGLSAVAACAPSEQFLYMGGPLAIGLGLVFASSLAGMWLPPTTALGAGLASMSLYGGLILFSAFLLYDTQRMVRKAETHPLYGFQPYDPVNNSLSIYMDVINIFIRIATILSGSTSSKR